MKYIKKHYKQLLLIIGMNIGLVLLVELFWRRFTLGSWIVDDLYMVFANAAFIIMLSGIMTLLTKKYSISFVIVSNIMIVLGLINAKKIALRNVPLLIDDVSLVREAFELIPQFASLLNVLLLSLAIALLTFMSYKLIKHEKKWFFAENKHILAAVIISILFLIPWQMTYGNETDISSSGLLLSLINDMGHEDINYDFEEYELEVVDPKSIESEIKEKKFFESQSQPNVIVIQSEAFWDVNKLDLNFNKDPIPNFHQLQEESMHGYMYVPVIGGGTVNTEFEILTGMTLKNYDFDSYMVYPNDIHQATVSLASIFRNHGYYTLATHPFNGWYYNRSEVFKYMGFHEFVPLEFMDEPEKLGSYVTDRFITDEIIKNIEEHDQPLFNTVLTMQNHAPFNDWRFKRDELTITFNDLVSEESLDTINNYANSIYLSDIELKRLVDYLRTSDEETILLFYGDHLPYMGDDYKVFRETDYIGDEIFVDENLEMMSTPFIVWSNFNNEEKDLGIVNASYIPAIILNEMDIERPLYMTEIYHMYEQIPVFTRKTGYLADGSTVDRESELYQDHLKKYFYLSTIKDVHGPWLIEDNSEYNKAYDMELIQKPD